MEKFEADLFLILGLMSPIRAISLSLISKHSKCYNQFLDVIFYDTCQNTLELNKILIQV